MWAHPKSGAGWSESQARHGKGTIDRIVIEFSGSRGKVEKKSGHCGFSGKLSHDPPRGGAGFFRTVASRIAGPAAP
jgi:hypothetical protein